MTSPKFPIVLMYTKDELTLLHVRDNITGTYLSEYELRALQPPFPIVENVKHKFLCDGLPQNLVSWAKLKAYAETAEKVEGVVIQFGQEMIKLKTLWYCNLHHSVTFTRWRDVARSVLADQSDDLKSAFAMTGRDIAPILVVERGIKAVIDGNASEVQAVITEGQGLTAKDMALKYREHPLFGLIMRAFRNQEINWMEWYAKNHTDDWSLEVIGDEA
jgi:RNA ligase